VRAWGALWDIIRSAAVPARGFLLHAYGGPAEMVRGFIGRGAYFSFSPSFLHERKAPQREIFRQLPPDRLLVETDAPDLAPPPEQNPRPLVAEDGTILNHPANLLLAYDALAAIRGVSREEVATHVAENFARLFG
jgi:TatD DNase family protein